MTYLIAQILVCLSLAAAIGLLVGWLLRHFAARRREALLTSGWQERLEHQDTQISTMQKHLKRETASLAAAQQHASDAESRARAADTRIEALQRSVIDRDKQLTELADQLATLRDKLRPLQQQLADSRSEITTLTAELAGYRRKIRPLEQDAARLDARRLQQQERIAQLEAKLAEHGDLAATLRQRDDKIAALEAQLGTIAAQRRVAADAGRPAPPLAMEKPAALFSSPPSAPDDLKKIRGIGRVLERTLNELGVYEFAQIAGFTAQDVAWIDSHLAAFKGRIQRDDWVNQARQLRRRS